VIGKTDDDSGAAADGVEVRKSQQNQSLRGTGPSEHEVRRQQRTVEAAQLDLEVAIGWFEWTLQRTEKSAAVPLIK
jgi:hypothetical protein